MQIVASLGVAGVLGWYLYYTTTVSFPKMNDSTLARMDALADRQSKVMENICKDFAQTIREERVIRREEISMLRDELRHLRGLDDTVNREGRGTV
jgi:proline dehydrogenase